MTNFQMFGLAGAAGGLAVGIYSSGMAAIQAEANIRMNGMTRGVDLANSSTGRISFGKYNVTTPTVSIPANATVTTYDFTA
ncbi:MAG: hypothetical protein PW791_09280 [Neorhizobium sp.]|nr:hypothetical protein [Neorhizobium sp.]